MDNKNIDTEKILDLINRVNPCNTPQEFMLILPYNCPQKIINLCKDNGFEYCLCYKDKIIDDDKIYIIPKEK